MDYLFYFILILIIITFLVSILIYHRSITATISEFIIKLVYKIFDIDAKISNKEDKLSKYKFKSKLVKTTYQGYNVYTISKNNPKDTDSIIIYLHGGAYINEASYFHYRFVDQIATSTNSTIIFPNYPLAPEHTCIDAFKMLEEMYKDILSKTDKKIIFMGDSAGGGLSLAFAEYLVEKKMKMPSKLILISPWVDISMTNKEMRKYESIDPMLDIDELIPIANNWKGNLDIKDSKVSPIYGNLKNIPDTLLFVGERELLYPDIILLNEKLVSAKVKTKFIIGRSMNHIYPLYPIKEAKKSLEEIINFVNE